MAVWLREALCALRARPLWTTPTLGASAPALSSACSTLPRFLVCPVQEASRGGRGAQQAFAEWMNEWVSEWMHEWMNEWVNEGMSEWMKKWVSEWMSEWRNEWVNEWVSEWINEWVNECMSEWRNEWRNEWVNEWVDEEMSEEWMSEWMNECVNEWMKELMHEWMNEWVNERRHPGLGAQMAFSFMVGSNRQASDLVCKRPRWSPREQLWDRGQRSGLPRVLGQGPGPAAWHPLCPWPPPDEGPGPLWGPARVARHGWSPVSAPVQQWKRPLRRRPGGRAGPAGSPCCRQPAQGPRHGDTSPEIASFLSPQEAGFFQADKREKHPGLSLSQGSFQQWWGALPLPGAGRGAGRASSLLLYSAGWPGTTEAPERPRPRAEAPFVLVSRRAVGAGGQPCVPAGAREDQEVHWNRVTPSPWCFYSREERHQCPDLEPQLCCILAEWSGDNI